MEGFESLFGIANGMVEGRESSALLPFVYRLHARDSHHLVFTVTDFHDNTWESVKNIEQLEDLRDAVGIGGSWHDFLEYLRAAFLSDNAMFVLGGPASAVGGYGATSGKLVGQKSKGMPKVSLSLSKLSDTVADDTVGDMGVQLCRTWKSQLLNFTAEQERSSQLAAALKAEREKALGLQEQVDSLSIVGSKRRGQKSVRPSFTSSTSQESQISMSQISMPTVGEALPERVGCKETAIRAKPRRVAPLSSRIKRKGTAIGDTDDAS